MNKTLIITGGTINEQFLVEEVKQNYETIIAVDKGLETALKLNIHTHHIIGDFDSLGTEFRDHIGDGVATNQKGHASENKTVSKCPGPFDTQIHKLNPEKDFTDTHMALKLALELGSTDITIIGWSGTRMDHILGNIQIMKEALEQNVKCRLINETNEIELINKKTIIEADNKYKYLSLIPLTTNAKGITLKGLKYPLQDAEISIGETIGISNEITEKTASIDIKEGILILIKSKD